MQIWALRCASFSPAAGTRAPQAFPSTALSNTFCSLTFWLTKETSLPTDPNYIPEQQENSMHLSSWRQREAQLKPSPAALLIQDIASHGSLCDSDSHILHPRQKGMKLCQLEKGITAGEEITSYKKHTQSHIDRY